MVDGITGISSNPTAAEYMKQTTGLSKDDFMKLFVTQLQYQDPLSPQDSSAFMQQMAQLTQVEQAYNANRNLTSLLEVASGTAGVSSVSFIGKEVTAAADQFHHQAGSSTPLGFSLERPAKELRVDIFDASGRLVKTLTQGTTAAGDGRITWDGTSSSHALLPTGAYRYAVTGVDASGTAFPAGTLVSGTVDGIRFDAGAPVVLVGGVEIPFSQVKSVTAVP
jgi:flagellar basal-body rod modification protein FlgD